ncbi:cytohesin-interacting protein-like [Varroa jacobsoni]|nr:cytohesin-interacting protein-like isoform X2 [Varroa destructor]XP_022656781.1 cytohesin-interacting protein-like isoform X2 [Varroa destructor]XP_022656782.1 cytohesin-interacting protein-like isoform X2 [Varroa destructor]XP_022656783.1 cytohesin-interacting protein-like isoform X2 [Varroa destructor]XP_022705467.1 cytohesin-interacting protein-like [Varroa jacobsoni]XP_022705468.1 cytohesin-interacting protein-like [Varroa jacobsoni]XP_022705469.1 cytohesin-interacting protein-like [Va
MNPVGHQTLPIMPRTSGHMPRSQSSRGQSGLGVVTGVNFGVGMAQHSTKRSQHQHAKHFITQTTKGSFTSYTASRVNDLPAEILRDRLVQTSAHEDHRRRTIIIERDQSQGGSFGFTLQTYGIRHREVSEIELITYVDSVEPYGSAARAGMRAGDVILSINGQDVESVDHNRLIQMIQACGKAMRVVVLFEDCVRRVALHVKLMQLKRSYQQKILEYNHYVEAERNMIETLRNKGVNTEHLVKGSTELLPLTSSSQDVLFPFRKLSRSFNKLSVSHSKSESRLLSDSASNIASSSSRRPTHHRDTSASCSTLPRLGGRRNSARSLPASTAVTPVGSLDGLEQGGAHFKSHRTCSTDFSDNGSTDGGLSSTEELEDEDGSPPPAKPPLPPKAKNQRQPTVVPNQGSDRAQAMISGVGSTSHERPPTLPPKRSQTQATSHLRSDVVTRL